MFTIRKNKFSNKYRNNFSDVRIISSYDEIKLC